MKLQHIGSLEKHASTKIFAKLKKHTNKYNSLQFPAEMNTTGSKTLTVYIPFHTNYDYEGRLSVNKDLFLHSSLHITMLWPQNHILHDFYAFLT